MKISKDTVKHVADLARLNISEAEEDKLTKEMVSIIEFADMLAEVDTDGVEPTNTIMEIQNVFRKDEIAEPYDRELILKNAPKQEAGCYCVPKVVE